MSRANLSRGKPRASLKAGRPRKDANVRQVYSVRLPPMLAQKAKGRAGGLTPAVEQALTAWLSDSP